MPNSISHPGPQHEKCIKWARDQGVVINGIEPARMKGRGLGIVAQRQIEVMKSQPLVLHFVGLNLGLGWGRARLCTCLYLSRDQCHPK